MATPRYKNISFDDRDENNLKYAGFWFHEGTWNASSVGQSGTLSSSNDPTANVTFNFPEPAVAFYYYGIPRSQGGRYAICIDCDPNAPNFESIDGLNSSDNGQNPPVVLYSRRNDTRFSNNNSQITIDRFELEVLDTTPVETVTQPGGSATQPTSSTPTSTASGSSTNVGAIAGGVLGGCAVLLAIIAAAFFLWRRKRQHPAIGSAVAPSMVESHPTQSTIISPYTLGSPSQNTLYSSATASTPGRRKPSHHTSSPSQSTFTTTTSELTSSDNDTTGTTSSRHRRRRRERRREIDAGRIDEDDDGETLPPDYDQVFRPAPATSQNMPSPSSNHDTGDPSQHRALSPTKTKGLAW
ncbi:hypothetical protein VNI00_015959 [Paramarasmius palmivorus]|uniref:Uncharacterized protein n=1 Tax=Paramarasmius palmivorus TaxID=297713 RepID=A0AAW0BGT5_9AGAR